MTTDRMRLAADAIEVLAFKMPAPNEYTPQFVQIANTMRNAVVQKEGAETEMMKKQPIATAPKNGTWVIISRGALEALAYWDGGFIGSHPGWVNTANGTRIPFEPLEWRRHPLDTSMTRAG